MHCMLETLNYYSTFNDLHDNILIIVFLNVLDDIGLIYTLIQNVAF